MEISKQMDSGKFVSLCPRVRKDGIIAVGGWVEKSFGMSYNNQQPIVLPHKHILSRLYAEHSHRKDHLGAAFKIRLKYCIIRLM